MSIADSRSSSRLARVGAATVAVVAALAWGPAQALTSRAVETQAVSVDLFPPSGPVTPSVDYRSAGLGGPDVLQSDSWLAQGGYPFLGGGFAYATASESGTSLRWGTAAIARSWGNLSGSAHARMQVAFDLKVRFVAPSDPIGAALWSASMAAAGCGFLLGCTLTTDFTHDTHGRIAYAPMVTDRQASFEEHLTIAGSDSIGVAGKVTLGFNPSGGRDAVVGLTGAWGHNDLTTLYPATSSQLGLYPAGDPRNTLDDPLGTLAGFDLAHLEIMNGRPAVYSLTSPVSGILEGVYRVTLDQEAIAAEGSSSYNFSLLAVDFAHTSTFNVGRVADPTGRLDLSLASLELSFVPVPVPEPAAAVLMLAGLCGVAAIARRREATPRGSRSP